jgi:nitrogen-specific signal transduction histidine kinase
MLRLAGELIEGALERRRALAELREVVREQVQQEDRIQSMSEMARSVVHDFRNLLTLISGSSDMLLLRPDYLEDKERVRRGLTQIKKAVGDLDNMLRRLRQFYRPRSEGEIFTAINLSELVRGVLPTIEVQLQGRVQAANVSVALRTEIAPDLPLIQGNGTELREVITNLLLNAADAVVEKGIGAGTLVIRTSQEKDSVVLEVEDDGCGMKAEVLQRCLEPNFTTKGSRGMGLGLALVVGVLQRHLGHIEVHSERGHGTTFRLHFPRVAQAPMGEGQRPLTILIVEDDSLIRDLLLDFLTDNGHHVQLASGGYRALQTFQGNWFDLVVVSQRLSDELDGERLGTMIKEIAPQKPVILIADDEPGEAPSGVDRVLTKPFDLANLNDMIHDLTQPTAFGVS